MTTQWEYFRKEIFEEEFEDRANFYGKNGWELTSVLALGGVYVCFFKRPLVCVPVDRMTVDEIARFQVESGLSLDGIDYLIAE